MNTVLVSPEAVLAWEDAYRRYTHMSDVVGRSHGKDPRAINELIAVSRSVASAWREITAHAELPWWLTAAVASAAEAFDEQAHQDQAALEYVTPRATQTRPEGGQWR